MIREHINYCCICETNSNLMGYCVTYCSFQQSTWNSKIRNCMQFINITPISVTFGEWNIPTLALPVSTNVIPRLSKLVREDRASRPPAQGDNLQGR